jgi:ACR3 family arsenite efflux pump ArsB
LINLFDPPPLESLNLTQKTGRVLLLTITLVVASILFAMLGALGLFIMERGRELGSAPQFYDGLIIILVGIAVNIACVFVLMQIKKADNHLIVPTKK